MVNVYGVYVHLVPFVVNRIVSYLDRYHVDPNDRAMVVVVPPRVYWLLVNCLLLFDLALDSVAPIDVHSHRNCFVVVVLEILIEFVDHVLVVVANGVDAEAIVTLSDYENAVNDEFDRRANVIYFGDISNFLVTTNVTNGPAICGKELENEPERCPAFV